MQQKHKPTRIQLVQKKCNQDATSFFDTRLILSRNCACYPGDLSWWDGLIDYNPMNVLNTNETLRKAGRNDSVRVFVTVIHLLGSDFRSGCRQSVDISVRKHIACAVSELRMWQLFFLKFDDGMWFESRFACDPARWSRTGSIQKPECLGFHFQCYLPGQGCAKTTPIRGSAAAALCADNGCCGQVLSFQWQSNNAASFHCQVSTRQIANGRGSMFANCCNVILVMDIVSSKFLLKQCHGHVSTWCQFVDPKFHVQAGMLGCRWGTNSSL